MGKKNSIFSQGTRFMRIGVYFIDSINMSLFLLVILLILIYVFSPQRSLRPQRVKARMLLQFLAICRVVLSRRSSTCWVVAESEARRAKPEASLLFLLVFLSVLRDLRGESKLFLTAEHAETAEFQSTRSK